MCLLAVQFGTCNVLAEPKKDVLANRTPVIPVELGGIKLGAGLGNRAGNREVSLFGCQGTLTADVKNGTVSIITFRCAYDDGEGEKVEADLRSKLTKLCGSLPVKEYYNDVWRGSHSVLRLSLGREFAIVLQSNDPRAPGNPGDGFDKFIMGLKAALAKDNAEEAAKFFKFPFVDYFGRAYPAAAPAIECKNQKEFVSKYHSIFDQKRKKEFIEAEGAFDASSQSYAIRSDPSEFIIRRDQGRWHITEFAYRE